MFDPSKLSNTDKDLLTDFFAKRKLFDNYIQEKDLKIFTCPGCGYPTITERGGYDICSVCNWEDDGQDDKDADKILGGPNGALSLTENRINIGITLNRNADLLKGKINLDPFSVLETIALFDKKKDEIGDRMTGDEPHDHPIWTKWRQVEKDLQIALINAA